MESYRFNVTCKKTIHVFLYTLAFDTIIAVLLTVIGFGNGFLVNFTMSQCIGLSNCALIMLGLYVMRPEKQIPLVGLVLGALFIGSATGMLIGAGILGIQGILFQKTGLIIKILFISVLFGAVISYFFGSQERMRRSSALFDAERIKRLSSEKQAAEAELKMLQAQIEPHFLYNTLFNIHSLLDVDVKSGKGMLENLYRFLRISLSRTRKEKSTIEQEIQLIQEYLAIYKNRMNERLQYRIEVPEDIRPVAFPPMLLQPLVENAIKHGLEPLVRGGHILIRAEKAAERIRLEIIDTGIGFNGDDAPGIGLANIRERLNGIYGDNGILRLEENRPSGVKAIIEFPYA